MTIVGAWIETDACFVWADTEIYWPLDCDDLGLIPGHPCGYHMKLKLSLNERAAAAFTGDMGGIKRVSEAVNFADSFDELVSGLGRYLLEWAEFRAEGTGKWPTWSGGVAGWSRRLGRMMAATIDPPDFSPKLSVRGFATPHVDEFERLHPREPADLFGLARAQMREIQKSYPYAGAGAVTVAHLLRNELSLTAFDIETGHQISLAELQSSFTEARP